MDDYWGGATKETTNGEAQGSAAETAVASDVNDVEMAE